MVHFSQFYNIPLQFLKTTLHWLYQLFCKNTTFTVFVRFLKKSVNFTRSYAFSQIAQFYALQMLKTKYHAS